MSPSEARDRGKLRTKLLDSGFPSGYASDTLPSRPSIDALAFSAAGGGARGTCGSRRGLHPRAGIVLRLHQDHGVALVVVDHVLDHGDFGHGVQLIRKVLKRGREEKEAARDGQLCGATPPGTGGPGAEWERADKDTQLR